MKTVKLFLTLGILVLLNVAAVPAQEKAPEKLGKVSFPTSCDRRCRPSSTAPSRCFTPSGFSKVKKPFARC